MFCCCRVQPSIFASPLLLLIQVFLFINANILTSALILTLKQMIVYRENHQPTNTFSFQELQQFNRDGFILVKSLADSQLIKQILNITNELLIHKTPSVEVEYEAELGYPGSPTSTDAPGGLTPRRFRQAIFHHPALFDWALHPNVVNRLYQILDTELVLSLAHHNAIMVKDPRYSSDTGWHRDVRYWRFQRPELVSVHLALTSETSENGCLSFLPGTHRVNFHSRQLDEAQFLRAESYLNKYWLDKEVKVDLEPGDVLFFHCMTFHAAMRNRSSNVKKSVIFTYHPANNLPIAGTRSASVPGILLNRNSDGYESFYNCTLLSS